MKRVAVNAFVLTTSIAILYTVTLLGGAYLLSPSHLLIPRPFPAVVILDILILCVLPAMFVAATYVLTYIWLKNKDLLNSFLNIMPLILLVTVIFAVDNTFRHAVREFSESEFLSYTTPAGIAFVFPNIGRIWLVAIFASIILAVLKCEFMPNILATPSSGALSEEVVNGRFDGAFYFMSAFFMPSILLFNLYNRNRIENHIIFTHVLILAGILAVLGILIFLASKRVTKSAEVALLICILVWLCFWLFEALFGVVARYYASISSTQLVIVLVSMLAFLLMILRRYMPLSAKVRPAFKVLAISLIALFIFNIIPGVNHELVLHRARVAGADEENAPFYIKREFFIDHTLPSPDIYWVHVDGMMSMETVEQFFRVSQEHLREELARRGFIVNPNAELNAGYTVSALPALLSPTFYDSFFENVLNSAETELLVSRQRSHTDALAQVGLTLNYVSSYHELLSALIERGYNVHGISSNHITIVWYTGFWHRFLSNAGDLPELLNLTTPLSITPISERIVIEVELPDYDYEPLARFTWTLYGDTHGGSFWQHDPTITTVDPTAFHVYPLAYAQIARRALNFVDSVLEENPSAVIILQADHGLHLQQTQEHLLSQGYSLDQVVELIHSVFSAVRIPPEYGGLDAPIAPLNISRELVNRFVGKNYTLLQDD